MVSNDAKKLAMEFRKKVVREVQRVMQKALSEVERDADALSKKYQKQADELEEQGGTMGVDVEAIISGYLSDAGEQIQTDISDEAEMLMNLIVI